MVRCQPKPDEDSFLEPDPRAQVKRDYTEQRNRSAGVGAGFVLLKGWLKKGHLGNKKDDHTVLELISVQRLMPRGGGQKGWRLGKKDVDCFRVYFKGQKRTFGLLAIL